MSRPLIAALPLAALVLAASGCLVVSSKSIDESGVRVTSATLDQIEPGVTTEAWIVATLGEPTARTVVDGDPTLTVLRYDHELHRSGGGTVFLLFAGDHEERRVTKTFFEIADRVVSRYWIER